VQNYPRGAATQHTRTPPVIPTRGAYLGAWVEPHNYTAQGRVTAVHALESQLGRRLDIVHTYRRTSQRFPTVADTRAAADGSYLLLSLALGDARNVVAGRVDRQWHARAVAIRRFGSPVFVEPQWEFDRPNLRNQVHGGRTYVAAWRHLHALFAAAGVRNVAWVWCPTAEGFAHGRALAYYPGNRQVDWLCVDAYPGSQAIPLSTLIAPFLRWAHGRHKPVMIGEFGVPRSVPPYGRAHWLDAAARTMRRAHVRAAVYFDSTVNPDLSGTAAQDFRVDTDPQTFAAFRRMARSAYFDPQQLAASS
jgi:hypothetical protein